VIPRHVNTQGLTPLTFDEPIGPVIEPWLDDPFPDYDHEPVFAEN